MNMPTVSPLQPAAASVPPLDLRPRRLEDGVFQTAEEAVLVDGQGNAFAEPLAASPPPAGSGRGFSIGQALRAQVAARPCQSALLAAAAGALAMMLLRSQLRGRMPSLRQSWRR